MSRYFATAIAAGLLLFGAPPAQARAQGTKPDTARTGMPGMPGMAGKPQTKPNPAPGKKPGAPRAAAHAGHDMAVTSDTISDGMEQMRRPLDISHTRSGSGTSWLPDASTHREYQLIAGSWMLMAHGVLDLYYDDQRTPRGDTQFGSANWVMGMAMRELGGGMLQLDAMLSAEPWTVCNTISVA